MTLFFLKVGEEEKEKGRIRQETWGPSFYKRGVPYLDGGQWRGENTSDKEGWYRSEVRLEDQEEEVTEEKDVEEEPDSTGREDEKMKEEDGR